MIASTHVAFATTLYLGGAALFEYPPTLLGWALAAGASLLPDVDLPTSRLGRVLFWLSTRLERTVGHRTLTHSLVGLTLVGLAASPVYLLGFPVFWWAILGGYWSHLWLDMLNRRGIDLLWPSPVRVVMPGNPRYRLEAGSKAEMVLLTGLLAFALLLYPVSGLGLRTGLAHLLGNFDMARDAYLKHAGERWYGLRLVATDNLTLARVEDTCPVVGVWRGGLIVRQGGALRAIGENLDAHDLYPIHVELLEGEPLQVVTQRVDLRGRTLGWLLGQLDHDRTLYLSGELRMGERRESPIQDLDHYRPAWFSGQVLRLHLARPEDLEPYRGLVAAEGEVYVQVWLRPGDPAVELVVEEAGTVEVIPEVLKRFL